MTYSIANFIMFQVGWWACVKAGAEGQVWAGPATVAVLVCIHLFMVEDPFGELRLILLCAVLGPWVDWYLVQKGIYLYTRPTIPAWPAPSWIIALWALLGMTLRHCLGWLQERKMLALVLGAVGGPLSYAAGARMGALRFGDGEIQPPLYMAMAWGLAMPLLFWLAKPRKTYA